jgi:hypothetical protein
MSSAAWLDASALEYDAADVDIDAAFHAALFHNASAADAAPAARGGGEGRSPVAAAAAAAAAARSATTAARMGA